MELNILIAEDEQLITDFYLEFINEFFDDKKITFTVKDNGLSALEETLNKKFDLIISDINMPHMDGLGLTKKIHDRDNPNHKTPIIIISGTPHSLNFSQDNLYYLMAKPIAQERFERVLRLIIDGNLLQKSA